MKILEPIVINGMRVPNRVMVPAMVTRLAGEDGFVTQAISDRYVRYAKGEVGLIVVEAMAIHDYKAGPLLRISDDKYIAGLKEMNRKIHDTSDSKTVPQLIHFLKIARSGWRQTVEMLTKEDIDLIVEQFGQAAARAREAGFDGIELHNAHGYTLASFVSSANRRSDEYGGKTLESRLRLIGRVMDSVRRHVGHDFPVGIRFLAEEFLREGYTVEDAKLIGLRMAQLGADYLSLSVGGKFEDAVHKPGEVLHAYSGYSGDRCMPGDRYPRGLNLVNMAQIRAFIRSKGYTVPVIGAGKLSDPKDAEEALVSGSLDLVAIARGLLADPDWVRKLRQGALDRVVLCDYCNVCKQLDGAHQPVTCYMWPKGALQAPDADDAASAPTWADGKAGLTIRAGANGLMLKWNKAQGDVVYYDLYRADDEGEMRVIDGVKATTFTDTGLLGGMRYRYYVRACDATGHASAPSEVVHFEAPLPEGSRLPEAATATA